MQTEGEETSGRAFFHDWGGHHLRERGKGKTWVNMHLVACLSKKAAEILNNCLTTVKKRKKALDQRCTGKGIREPGQSPACCVP